MARRFSRDVDSAIAMAAERYRINPATLRAIAKVESSGNPRAQTGSYSGLFQLSRSEFQRGGGGRGDIYDPTANAMAAAANFRSHQDQFERKFERAPSPTELYMIHQQGWGGFQAHMDNPDRPAWENMASTREGRARGEEWSRRAIRGNTLPDARQHGDRITSRQFMDSWTARLNREPGLTLDTAAAAVPTVPDANNTEAVLSDWRGERGVDPEAAAYAGGTPAPLNQDEASAFADRDMIVAQAPEPRDSIVAGVNDPIQATVGDIFQPAAGKMGGGGGGFGMGNIGAGLAAAGKALSSVRITPHQSPDVGAQMAALDRDAQQPVTIQPRKPRQPPGRSGQSRGGAA